MTDVLRSYQKYLVAKCMEDNQVVVLPTGAGKTLIAIHMILEALELHPSRVAIFLAPTVALCYQQADAIRKGAFLLTGRVPKVNVSVHQHTRNWRHMSLQKTVLLATPQKFLNDLGDRNEEKLPWSRCSILVMDECHHAMKSHPYGLIMESYDFTSDKPKFVGLTASPAAHASAAQVEARIKALCQKLCSKIAVLPLGSDYYKEMMEKTHIPEVQCYDISDDEHPLTQMQAKLIEQGRICLRKMFESDVKLKNSEGESISRYDQLPTILDWLAKGEGGDHGNDAYNYFAAAEIIQSLGSKASLTMLANLRMAHETEEYQRFKGELEGMQSEDPPLLRGLWNILKEEAKKHPKTHRGIIFVDTRQMARDLVDLITNHEDPVITENVFPATFLGHTNRRDAIRMLPSEQKEILQQFGEGKEVNLLVATSIAEEGIDITACNFVVRLNARMTPIKMIQSRGRARYPDSSYYVICTGEEDRSFVQNAMVAEMEMLKCLEKMSLRSENFYTCQTTWNLVDPTIANNIRLHHHLTLAQQHPVFANNNFKRILSAFLAKRCTNPHPTNYRTTSHDGLWKTVLTVDNEYVFHGKPLFRKMETEQWAAMLACCYFRLVDLPFQ